MVKFSKLVNGGDLPKRPFCRDALSKLGNSRVKGMEMTEIEAAENAKEADVALQKFLEEKKGKKSPSRTDAAEFEALWLAFADAQGLTAAMPLLCQGFAFAAADPLYVHMKQKGMGAKGYSLLGT